MFCRGMLKTIWLDVFESTKMYFNTLNPSKKNDFKMLFLALMVKSDMAEHKWNFSFLAKL